MSSIKCKICEQITPLEFSHSHHVQPQAAGGTDGLQVKLCGSCHTNLHLVATMLNGPKAGQATATIATSYQGDVGAQKRCMYYAIEVAKWMQRKKDGLIPQDPNEEIQIMITLPLKIKNALQIEAAAVRHSRSGRQVGMARLASGIITDYLVKKYPKLAQAEKSTQGAKPELKSPVRIPPKFKN